MKLLLHLVSGVISAIFTGLFVFGAYNISGQHVMDYVFEAALLVFALLYGLLAAGVIRVSLSILSSGCLLAAMSLLLFSRLYDEGWLYYGWLEWVFVLIMLASLLLFIYLMYRSKRWYAHLGLFIGAVIILSAYIALEIQYTRYTEMVSVIDAASKSVQGRLQGSECKPPLAETPLAKVEEKYAAILSQVTSWKAHFPESEVDNIKVFLEDIAKKHGIKIKLQESGKTQENEAETNETVIIMSVQGIAWGDTRQYQQFIADVSNREWRIVWESKDKINDSHPFIMRYYLVLDDGLMYDPDKELIKLDRTMARQEFVNRFCRLKKNLSIALPYYARRIKQQRADYLQLCLQQYVYKPVFLREQELRDLTGRFIGLVTDLQDIARLNQSDRTRGFKPKLPIPCYK